VRTISDDNKGPSHFPLEYFVDFLKFLRKHDDVIEIITYDELSWGNDYDYTHNYPKELKNWRRGLYKGLRDNRKIYVLIQHDVDGCAECTMTLLREEERLRIPSNVMVFNRRIHRRLLESTGELQYTDYDLDYQYLRHLQDESGFVIGYHSNAYEQARFDLDKALLIFEDDVRDLRKYFTIKYFSPHGGARSPEGLSNNILPIPESLKFSLRWVQNRQSVRFDGQYSDGGLNSPERDPASRDLRDFVRKWEPGRRYRVLVHPEYYHTPYTPSPRMIGTPWYDNLLSHYESKKGISAWDNVHFKTENEPPIDKVARFVVSLKKLIRRYYVR
jgi:hypothetical protein